MWVRRVKERDDLCHFISPGFIFSSFLQPANVRGHALVLITGQQPRSRLRHRAFRG